MEFDSNTPPAENLYTNASSSGDTFRSMGFETDDALTDFLDFELASSFTMPQDAAEYPWTDEQRYEALRADHLAVAEASTSGCLGFHLPLPLCDRVHLSHYHQGTSGHSFPTCGAPQLAMDGSGQPTEFTTPLSSVATPEVEWPPTPEVEWLPTDEDLVQAEKLDSAPMLKRYLSSSSEEDGCNIEAIATEAKRRSTEREQMAISAELRDNPHKRHCPPHRTSHASGSSVASIGSCVSLSERRKTSYRYPPEKKVQKNDFPCTFCMSTFSNPGNWKRHEETIHLIRTEWICSPEGAVCPATGLCVFCNSEPSSCSAACGSGCSKKPVASRTFCRKEHLKQHMRIIHNVLSAAIDRDAPRTLFKQHHREFPTESRCGFCDEIFGNWNDRCSHLIAEFRAGKTMDQWEGDWGLSAEWMQRLEGRFSVSKRRYWNANPRPTSSSKRSRRIGGADQETATRSRRSPCKRCREVKVKCIYPVTDGKCTRCERLCRECNRGVRQEDETLGPEWPSRQSKKVSTFDSMTFVVGQLDSDEFPVGERLFPYVPATYTVSPPHNEPLPPLRDT